MRDTLQVQQTQVPMQQIQNKNVDMRKSNKTMQYLTPRKEFVAENRQAQSQSGTIPPCPKSLEVSPSDLLDDDEKVLKFDAFLNECLKNENKGSM